MYDPSAEIARLWNTFMFIFGLIAVFVIFGYYIKAELYLKYWPNELIRLKLKKKLAFIEDLEA